MQEKNTASEPKTSELILRVVLELAVDYFRWTQLVPMIFAWAFLLLSVIIILLLNFQHVLDALVVSVWPLLERWELLTEEQAETGDISISLEDSEIKGFVYKAWAIVAVIGYLLGQIIRLITGPRPTMSLPRKLGITAMACVLASIGLFAAFFFGSEEFTGSSDGWFVMFIFGPLAVWLISAYSLSVGHVLQKFKEHSLPKITHHIRVH